MKLFNITNHTLTPDQIADARASLGVTEIVEMPDDLKQAWANIDPRDPKAPKATAKRLLDWLGDHHRGTPYAVLLAGQSVAVYRFLRDFGYPFRPAEVYAATSERVSVDDLQPDGSVIKRSVFKHVAFMPY